MVLLARGNRADAQALLTKAQALAVGSSAVTQGALASALVHLDDGATELAVREVLGGLANARAQRDWRGERAALSLLAACYRRLDRPAEAERLQRAARALLAEAPSGSPGL
jgi:Flp pilus assembly protein TadD